MTQYVDGIAEIPQSRCIVSDDYRTITIPAKERTLGCVGDDETRRVWWEVPLENDGISLRGFALSIHYMNAAGHANRYDVAEAYVVDNRVLFAWLVQRGAYEAAGLVSVSIKMRALDGTNVLDEFNSTTAPFTVKPAQDYDEQPQPEQVDYIGAFIEQQEARVTAKLALVDEAIADAQDATAEATTAATAANGAAAAADEATAQANSAAGNANQAATDIREAAERGDFDGEKGDPGEKGETGATGAPGKDGADGYSPTVTTEQTATGATITITDKNGAHTATIANGERGPQGDKGDPGENANEDGYYPLMFAGAAESYTPKAGAESTWIRRVAGGADGTADGLARIESIKGNTLVWNQLVNNPNDATTWPINNNGVFEKTVENGVCKLTVLDNEAVQSVLRFPVGANFKSGHKYLFTANSSHFASNTRWNILDNWTVYGNSLDKPGINNVIIEATGDTTTYPYASITLQKQGLSVGDVIYIYSVNAFDLTRMFGAGNEPATVEEFEALFPDSYYPYDAGSLLNVSMQGVRTVGFNQWDIESIPVVQGAFVQPKSVVNVMTVEYIRVFPGMEYEQQHDAIAGVQGQYVRFYDADKNHITDKNVSYYGNGSFIFTVPNGAMYARFMWYNSNGITPSAVTNANPCLHFTRGGYRNGEYEEYWQQERTIDTGVYFPDGIKSVGNVHDELTADKAIKRIRELVFTGKESGISSYTWSDYTGFAFSDVSPESSARYLAGRMPYVSVDFGSSNGEQIPNETQFAWLGVSNRSVYLLWANCPYSTITELTDWLAARYASGNPVKFYYPYITPAETEITPPLDMHYRVADGGTEEIIATEQTAPPTMETAYPVDLLGDMETMNASIAAVESTVATSNHAVGSYFVVDNQLYKATRAIATGETIAPGTNCTPTTVMAELVALTS